MFFARFSAVTAGGIIYTMVHSGIVLLQYQLSIVAALFNQSIQIVSKGLYRVLGMWNRLLHTIILTLEDLLEFNYTRR